MSSASASNTSSRPTPGGSTKTGVSLPAAVVSVLAAAALIISLAGPTWFALVGKLDVDFPTVRTLTSLDSAPTIQAAYFAWLGWTLAIVVIVVLLATVLLPMPAIARTGGLVVIVLSLAGAVLTLVAIYQLDNQDSGGSFFDHFGWLRIGGYLHVVGWVLAIVAAVLASRGRTDRSR